MSLQRCCWGAAAAGVLVAGLWGCLALQPQWLQPVPCIKHVGLKSCNRNLNRGIFAWKEGLRVFG